VVKTTTVVTFLSLRRTGFSSVHVGASGSTPRANLIFRYTAFLSGWIRVHH
jgi:hypothetical protein